MVHPQATANNTLTAATVESVMLDGDLSKLSAPQRVSFYRAKCDSLGLNWLTQPFAYITLNGKLTLYARKDAADQLRKKHGISIDKPDITFTDDWIIVNVLARTPEGRTDADTGVVNKKDMRGDFGNALMKAITKAKRRVTLSICGLGMMDETEVDSVPFAQPVAVDTQTGEIHSVSTVTGAMPPAPHSTPAVQPVALTPREPGDEPDDIAYAMSGPGDESFDDVPEAAMPRPLRAVKDSPKISEAQAKRLFAISKAKGWTTEGLKAHLASFGYEHSRDIVRAHYDDIIASLDEGVR